MGCNMKFGYFLSICFILGCFYVKTSHSVELQIIPESPVEDQDAAVSFVCSPGEEGKMYQEILFLQIDGPDSKAIATIRDSSNLISHGKQWSGRFHATGQFSSDTSQSYLNLTVSAPTRNDSGTYTCVMFYLDPDGILQSTSLSHNMTVTQKEEEKPEPELSRLYLLESALANLLDRVLEVDSGDGADIAWVIGLTDPEKEDLSSLVGRIVGGKNFTDVFVSKSVTDRLDALESKLANQTAEMEDKLNEVDSDRTQQKEDIQDLKNKVDTVIQDKHSQDHVISTLEDADSKMAEDIRNLNNVTDSQSNVIDALEGYVSALTVATESGLKDLNKTIGDQADHLSTLTDKVTFSSAFTATNDHENLPLQPGMTLAFQDMLLDQGEGYDRHTGVYTAPRTGLYFFFLHVLVGGPDHGAILHLMANQTEVARLTARQTDHRAQSAVSSMVRLEAGDVVSVLVVKVYGTDPYLFKYESSIFGGFLVQSL